MSADVTLQNAFDPEHGFQKWERERKENTVRKRMRKREGQKN